MPYAPDLSGCALEGRYELHAVIGEGAFGRVYSGRDRRLERPVAIKMIKPWWADDPEWVRSFEREAQLLARVSDPGIVQIFDVGHAREGLYFVSELVEGESLAVRLRRGPLPAWEAAALAEQLSRALGHAHAQHVIHRDIKPANILLSSDGQVKVGDFGVARLAEGSTDGGSATIVGTPRYMAPEQARGQRMTAATDVYSVGIVLYEMLAGRPPFTERGAVELAMRHLNDRPEALARSTPKPIVRIVDRALAKSPGKRYRDGREMADALADACRAAPAKTRSTVGGGARSRQRSHAPRPQALSPSTAAPNGKSPPVTPSERANGGALWAAGASPRRSPPPRAPTPPRPAAAAPAGDPVESRTGGRVGGRPGGRGPDSRPATTRVAPKLSRRRNLNPSGRRRAAGALSFAFLVLAAMIGAAILVGSTGHVRVPRLAGLRMSAVKAKAQKLSLQPKFRSRFASAPKGTVIAQAPRAGRRVKDGTTVRVVLSAGPPPVKVPQVAGDSAGDAQATIQHAGLKVRVHTIIAPGVPAGTVTSQSPAPGVKLARGSRVSLNVAEVPHWQPVTSIAGGDSERSVVFHVRGTHWRVVYTMGYHGTCTFIFICSGPSASISNSSGGSTAGFDLNDGSRQEYDVHSGPGQYRLTVSPGDDSTRWQMWVEDYY